MVQRWRYRLAPDPLTEGNDGCWTSAHDFRQLARIEPDPAAQQADVELHKSLPAARHSLDAQWAETLSHR